MRNVKNMRFSCANRSKPAPGGRSGRRAAFTLIELLAVIAIIAVLASMLLGVSTFAKRNAVRGRAKAEIEKIHNTLLEYQLDVGTYPETLGEIESRMPQGVDKTDPWGREYVYQKRNDQAYTLYSKGPKAAITGDDIYSAR